MKNPNFKGFVAGAITVSMIFLGAMGVLTQSNFLERWQDLLVEGQPDSEEQFKKHLFYTTIGRAAKNLEEELPEAPNNFTLELEVSSDRAASEKKVKSLIGQGFDAYYTPYQHNNVVVYRIRSGVFQTKESAEQARGAMAKKSGIRSKVVQL